MTAGGLPPSLAQPLVNKKTDGDVAESKAAAPSLASTSLWIVAYLASGVTQPLVMSATKYAGLADKNCQLYLLPYYVGMASVGLLACCLPGPRWCSLPLHRSAALALVGFCGQSLNWTGNMLAGSQVYAVIYASVTIWSALISRVLLQKALTTRQWSAIFIVVFGLTITGFGAKNNGTQVFLGACMVTAGAVLHATSHVLAEFVMSRGKRIPPHMHSCAQGCTATAISLTWQFSYTAHHFEKITEPMDAAGTSWPMALMLLGSLAVGNFIHAGAFYVLLTRIGAVSTGIIKGVQGCCVFIFSHVLYCGRDESQCFTPAKGVSLVVVMCGVACYIVATAQAKKL
eukprot:TRINITY_DN123639_c0_g1_i1.p1 TRINITY_DN123639_c0_g1~~TRINITY_DN123639_c0_g1_i1.p1  ORF type:complete len:343 (+),score=69.92 TRINITY_DN123639_c0_g1_i1:80-1108(+)